MTLPSTPKEAKLKGEKYYFTGKPCKNGHVDKRASHNGVCMSCLQIATAKWTEKHPEKGAEYARAYRSKNIDKLRAEGREYRRAKWATDPESMRAKQRAAYRRKVGEDNVKAFNRTPIPELVSRLDTAHQGKYKYVSGFSNLNAPAVFYCTEHNAEFSAAPSNVLDGAKSCPHCAHLQSAGEFSLAQYLAQYTEVQQRRRDLLDGKHEVDIYLPKFNLGIEYHGLFWHTKERVGNKHRAKWEMAQRKGLRLVQIFEDEWLFSRSMCEGRLMALLGLGPKTDARKCTVQQIPFGEARDFLVQVHSQGAGSKTSHCYGLFSEGALVAVATFGAMRNGAGIAVGGWEVLRYASKGVVRGGFGKLFSAFRTAVNPSEVISWCDLRWGNGRVYAALGFQAGEISVPDYWWVDCAARTRLSRYAVQKHKLAEHPELKHFYADGMSEKQVMESAGYKKILGVGSQKWTWTNLEIRLEYRL